MEDISQDKRIDALMERDRLNREPTIDASGIDRVGIDSTIKGFKSMPQYKYDPSTGRLVKVAA
jgi:hypothetical protein